MSLHTCCLSSVVLTRTLLKGCRSVFRVLPQITTNEATILYWSTKGHRAKTKDKEPKSRHYLDATEDDNLDQVQFECFRSDYLPA